MASAMAGMEPFRGIHGLKTRMNNSSTIPATCKHPHRPGSSICWTVSVLILWYGNTISQSRRLRPPKRTDLSSPGSNPGHGDRKGHRTSSTLQSQHDGKIIRVRFLHDRGASQGYGHCWRHRRNYKTSIRNIRREGNEA